MSLAPANTVVLQSASIVDRPKDRLGVVARDVLRKSLYELWGGNQKLIDSSIDIMPDERPRPDCGFVFVGLNPFETVIESDSLYEKVACGIKFAITMRTSDISRTKLGIKGLTRSRYSATSPKRTLSWITSMVIRAMQVNARQILEASNTAPEYLNQPPILHELSLATPGGILPPKEVTASHFSASQQATNTREEVGLLQEVTFDGGLWLHNLVTC